MTQPGLLWELFLRSAKGAPSIVSSNWAAYVLSGIIFISNSIWRFVDLSMPFRQGLREVWRSKKKDVFRSSALLAIFWIILFSASFSNILHEDRTSWNNSLQETQHLQQANGELRNNIERLKKENRDFQSQLAELTVAEPSDSLRRKTLKLVYDLSLFWNRRPTPLPKIQNPSTEEERERNAKFDKYWQDAEAAYRTAGFNERILEIVRQYKSKGIEIGFLEDEALQSNRQIGSEPFSGSGLRDCSHYWNDLCQLRELAYHVDPQDRPIVLSYEPRK